MKIMIASDLHGSLYYCKKTIEAFKNEGADRLLLLGDILYHGPRNDLPKDYDTKAVTHELNQIKDKILCVRGNCDADIDQMVLEFPILAEYIILYAGSRLIFATHGHIYNEEKLPPINKGDILLHGHTHVPACVEHESYTYINPGSVSIPKNGSDHGYMVLTDDKMVWKTFAGETFKEYAL